MIPAFNDMNTKNRHEWATQIIENRLIVMPGWHQEAKFLKEYVRWLRSQTKENK